MKRDKLFAPFLMLLAGAIASIVMYINQYDLMELLLVLFSVMLLFYLIGLFIQKKVLKFMHEIQEKEEQEKEGEVIEKGALEPGEDENASGNTEENKEET